METPSPQATSPATAAPLVTVVIPTFNRAGLLARAVSSVLAQTLTRWEMFVVIDGDDPATVAYLGLVGDPRVRWIAHATKRGPGEARNTGAFAGSAPFMAFLDDDDEWAPEKLAKQVALGEDGRAVVMTVSHVVTPEGTYVWPARPYDGRQPLDEWLFASKGGESFLQTSSLLVPRGLFDKVCFRDTNQHEEWELVLRSVKTHGYQLRTVPEPLTVHYMGGARKTQASELAWRNSMRWADELGLLTPRAYAGFLLTMIAPTAFNKGDVSGTLPMLRAAFARGCPGASQLARFALARLLPSKVRHRMKGLLRGGQASADARAVD